MEPDRVKKPPAVTLTDRDKAIAVRVERGVVGAGSVVGRYRITEHIGQGGMGVVFAAHDPELDRTVAVKLLRPDAGGPADRELRLRREAQVMARLAHPNVIRVYDVGEAFGSVFVAMEFVDGGTLRDWLVQTTRTQDEILAAFAQAGRGLAASHEAGLVHRDFKPSNVLVGTDGRVLVTDFGIARPITDPEPIDDGGGGSAVLATVTRTGGTPKYMAPEQHQRLNVDARADQFSFCVALWEALYRAAPFPGETSEALAASTSGGLLSTPPADHRVPAHVHGALVRGLQADPAARFPSLRTLLAALANDPQQQRRRRIRTAMILVGMLVIGFGAAWMLVDRGAAKDTPCPAPTERIAGVWSDARRATMHRAFSATATPLAEDAFARVARNVDAYTGEWTALHTEVCKATRIHHEQSELVLDLRMECLGRRLQELDAQLEVFVNADATVVQKAPRIAASLPSLRACDDVAALRATVRPPPDLVMQSRVAAVRVRLANARAAMSVAKYDDTLRITESALADARALGYRPLEAELLVVLGNVQHLRGDAKTAAKTLEDAAFAARAARDGVTELKAWAELVWLGGNYGRYEEAHAWARHGLAAFESLGSNDELPVSYLLLGLGTLLASEGKFEEALVPERRALAIREAAAPDSLKVAGALEALARVSGDLGRYIEQEKYIRRALAIYAKQIGTEHPEAASSLFNLAFALGGQGHYDEAIASFRAVVENWERNLGTQHPRLAVPVTNIGCLLIEQRKLDEALPYLERGLALAELKGPEHADVALATLSLGDLYRLQGKFDVALPYYRRAMAIWETSFGSNYRDLASVLSGIGLVELGRGAPAKALPSLERALQIRELQPGDLAQIADVRFALARALWSTNRDRKRAHELASKARTDHASLGSKSVVALAEIDAWLAAPR